MKLFFFRLKEAKSIMRILNVAEKNDAAKNIAAQLSNGSSRMVRIFFYT